MNEWYKLIITKKRNDNTRVSFAEAYPLRQECLVAAEEDFERWKKEPGVVALHLLRIDNNGVFTLRKYNQV